MLGNLSKQVKLCYDRAADAEMNAAKAVDPNSRQEFLEAATRWRKLARSYEFTEQLQRFIYKPPMSRNKKR